MKGGPEPIAIVGAAGLFPGAKTLEDFWSNILKKADASREVPEGRWPVSPRSLYDPAIAKRDRVYSLRGCLLDEIPLDLAGLNLDPDFVQSLDPLFHLALRVGRQAWAEARTEEVDSARAGVILANVVLPTETASEITRRLYGQDRAGTGADESRAINPANRYMAGLPAGLLARSLGLGGGSMTLDAACASSLYALKLACDELRAGRADAMLAGGISRPDCLFTQMGFSQLRALSASGRARPFDVKADGLVVGEGAGIFVLKRVSDAMAAGDKIYATIRGVGLSNDIGGGLLAPDSEGQLRAMRAAYRDAGWKPADVDLIECHATGTPLGDATEFKSLVSLWEGGGAKGSTPIGSVKSNIGHLLTAAGAAGLMKVLLSMRERKLPPSANFDSPGKNVALAGSPFRVQNSAEAWERRDEAAPRRAAVSAFGFGGINAHLLIEEGPGEVAKGARRGKGKSSQAAASAGAAKKEQPVALAIVGMETRFGSLGSLREFQEALLSGRSAATTRPDARWPEGIGNEGFLSADFRKRTDRGAYLAEMRAPAGRFRIPPKELGEMLPQQVLMLQAAASALEDAGLAETAGERAGVFIGIGLDLNTTNFCQRWGSQKNENGAPSTPPLTAGRTTGALGSIVASRIAREFRFGGPSFTVSAEENSGLRALEIAARALQSGEIDAAVVGAVDLAGDPRALWAADRVHAFSGAGDARPFDASAEGSIAGEGAVALVVKRLEDAVAAGDRVYGVIRGLGFAGGGENSKSAAPLGGSVQAYTSALKAAYAEAGVDPSTISYIETHGSGIPEEDALEARALKEFFRESEADESDARLPRAIGAIKPLVGHAGAASGLASLARASLCLYQQILPPLSSLTNPRGEFSDSLKLFHAPSSPQYWMRNRTEGPRRAGVSSMGLNGTCAHVVLEECEQSSPKIEIEQRQPLGAREEALFVVEANEPAGFVLALDKLAKWAKKKEHAGAPVECLARRWHAESPQAIENKLAVAIVAKGADELRELAIKASKTIRENPNEALDGNVTAAPRIFYSPKPLGREGKVAFVFPGSGNQYPGMGVGAGAEWPEVMRRLDGENERLLYQFAPWSFAPWRLAWPEGWEREAERRIVADHRSLIFGHVSHGAMMSDLIHSLGVQPDAVIGYSLGETAGYFATRAWTQRDEMVKRVRNSTLFVEDLVGRCEAARDVWGLADHEEVEWKVVAVDCTAEVARAAIKKLDRVYLLIVNTPEECVIGGQRAAVDQLVESLGCNAFPIEGVSTVHCEIAMKVQNAYRGLHLFKTTRPERIRFYGSGWGRFREVGRQSAADSIVAQAIGGLDFPRMIEQAYEDDARVFVEMGPRGSCTRMIGKILADRPHVARTVCVQGQNQITSILRLLARLIVERVPVDLAALYGLETRVAGHKPAQRAKGDGSAEWISIPLDGGRDDGAEEIAVEPEPEEERVSEKISREVVRGPVHGPVRTDEPELELDGVSLFGGGLSGLGINGNGIHSAEIAAALEEPVKAMALTQQATSEAHEAFLRLSNRMSEAQAETLGFQMALLQSAKPNSKAIVEGAGAGVARPHQRYDLATVKSRLGDSEEIAAEKSGTPQPTYSREACLEFARGKIANSLGPIFGEVDTFPSRVRLPDEPLMLVDRIMSVAGEPMSLRRGSLVTEHDVRPGAWYLDEGHMAAGVAIESGQADLFLSAYLGIDFATRGASVYRLLDAAVTFHGSLPPAGKILSHDINIDRFIRQGETHLFFFGFETTIAGAPVMTMRGGCAGFFTDSQLRYGKGIVLTGADRAPARGVLPRDWRPFVKTDHAAYDDSALEALRAGDLVACFGSEFSGLPLLRPVALPSGRLKLLDRVTALDPGGGRFGLGRIRAEIDIHPDDWFLTCHFVDDPVMPGTLMYESCLQALRIFLMRLGWIGESGHVRYEPKPGIEARLRCRGQVIPSTKKASYEIAIKELGYGPEPYAIADAVMYADGKAIVQVFDLSMQLTGSTREQLESIWRERTDEGGSATFSFSAQSDHDANPKVSNSKSAVLYDREGILQYCHGKPSLAFGEKYRVFDEERFLARLPSPPYLFMDRVTELKAEPWVMRAGGRVTAEYDVPSDAWYFAGNRQETIPFSVILEIPLQVCGWMAAYMGSALESDAPLHFRNLGGEAVLLEELGRDAGTLISHIEVLDISRSAGMILQKYSMRVTRQGRDVYRGETLFGFFSEDALANQVGIRNLPRHIPSAEELARGRQAELPDIPPVAPDDCTATSQAKSEIGLPARAYRMVDSVDLYVQDGGPHGLGFIRGSKRVNPADWFFKAHFYQDPVWPGSLGLEAFLQLLKFAAIERWGKEGGAALTFEPIALGVTHNWTYRGQILPKDGLVTIEAVVDEIRDDEKFIKASGHLAVDGRVIYQMKDFALRLKSR